MRIGMIDGLFHFPFVVKRRRCCAANANDVAGKCHRSPWHMPLMSLAYARNQIIGCLLGCQAEPRSAILLLWQLDEGN